MLLIVIGLGLTALAQSFGSIAMAWPLVLLDERLPAIFRLHMASAGLGIMLIALAILARRRPALHRPIGRVAAGLVVIAGLSALPSALLSDAMPLARAGFFAQGLVWLALVIGGVAAILRGHRAAHARLMVLMAAVGAGAVLLRPMLAVVAALGLPFDAAYAAIAWASWLMPLAVAAHSAAHRPVGLTRPAS